MTALPNEKSSTIEDIEKLPEGQRAELIDGTIYMQAAPLRIHQKISGQLIRHILNHIESTGKPCDAYDAPFAVYLDENYVEPDISVICDPTKLTEKGCQGAPDWVIEIVSPSTAMNDYVRKLGIYARSGVREYWIINPENDTVLTYVFSDSTLHPSVYSFEDLIPVMISDGFNIRINDLLQSQY